MLAVEKIRTRVARDLHDDMGSTLSTINILSAMAKSKMNSDPVKTAGYISKISDNSQRMMEAMDDIVWYWGILVKTWIAARCHDE